MHSNSLNRYAICLAFVLSCLLQASAASKIRYPGGKYFIYRYTLQDKAGSSYSIDHPGRWLSHKSIERRRRQGLSIDSTDLPVSPKYLRTMEKMAAGIAKGEGKRATEWHTIGTSRWNNTVLIRSNDTTLLRQLGELDFVKETRLVWISPDSIERGPLKVKVHEKWNPWDSIKGDIYANGKEQIEMLSGQRLHTIGCKGKGMTIAILDGGFQNCDQIPAVQHMNIVGVRDFVYPASERFYHETDHGTKVLSAMAANEPQVIVGTAPEARYWLLRCEDQQPEQPVEADYWAMAAEFAD